MCLNSKIIIYNILNRKHKLIKPSKRNVLSNVSPHMPHSKKEGALAEHNFKTISPTIFVKVR